MIYSYNHEYCKCPDCQKAKKEGLILACEHTLRGQNPTYTEMDKICKNCYDDEDLTKLIVVHKECFE